MKAYIAVGVAGVFAYDDDGKLLAYRLFPAQAEAIAQRLRSPEREVNVVVEELVQQGFTDIVSDNKPAVAGVCFLDEENKAKGFFDVRSVALELKWVSSPAELNKLISAVHVLSAQQSIRQERRDVLAMRVVSFLDELDAGTNVFTEMLKEWYGMHNAGVALDPLKVIKEGKGDGMPFSAEDKKNVKRAAATVEEMGKTEKALTAYLETLMTEFAPNCSAIAGPVLAARFLVHAGGLDKLARLPSTTIQILGAEKALFRHLKEHTKAPKYGILFAHPAIQQAPLDKRGKVARLIAAKLALAARMDFFTHNDRSKQLARQLKKDIAAVMK